MAGDHQVPVGGHYPHHAVALRRANDRGMTVVLLGIELDAEMRQPTAHFPPHRRRMLPDPPGEHQRVEAVEGGAQRADGLAQLIAEHIDGLSRMGIVLPPLQQGFQIRADA